MTFSRIRPLTWARGDTISAAQMEQLDLDHTRAVDGYTTGASGLTISSRSITRVLPYLWQGVVGTWGYADSYAYLLRTGVNTACKAQHPIRVPNGAVITRIGVEITPDTHATTPQNMPEWSLFKYQHLQASTPTEVIVRVGDLYTGDPTGYSVTHEIYIESQSVAVDNTDYMYMLILTTESGTNSAANCDIGPIKITYTTARLDED